MEIGEWTGLGAALCWAISSVIYGRTRLNAWTLNLGKNLIASAILVVHLAAVAQWPDAGELTWSTPGAAWLGLSGLIGILLGDTCYFRSLQILGPRRSLLLATTAPIFSAILGWFWLSESVPRIAVGGIGLTVFGIALVIVDRRTTQEAPGIYPGTVVAGVAYGLAGALCQATGIAIAKMGMASCDPLSASFIRLLTAGLCALPIIAMLGRWRATWAEILKPAILKRLIPAAIIGTWLGIWFSQIAVLHCDIAVATTLMTTSPLFAIPLVRICYGHPIRARAIVGTLLTLAGIGLIV